MSTDTKPIVIHELDSRIACRCYGYGGDWPVAVRHLPRRRVRRRHTTRPPGRVADTTDTVPWPFPGDNELDKARRIARDYRGALQRLAPDLCARMDEGSASARPEVDHAPPKPPSSLTARHGPCGTRIVGDCPKLLSVTDAKGVRRVRMGDLIDLERDMRTRRATGRTHGPVSG